MEVNSLDSNFKTESSAIDFFQNYEIPTKSDCAGKIRKTCKLSTRNSAPYVKVFNINLSYFLN